MSPGWIFSRIFLGLAIEPQTFLDLSIFQCSSDVTKIQFWESNNVGLAGLFDEIWFFDKIWSFNLSAEKVFPVPGSD